MSAEDGVPQPQIQAPASVRGGRAAVEYGAVEVYRFGGTDDLEEVVAQLAIGDSSDSVEDEAPLYGNFSPESVGGATVSMLLGSMTRIGGGRAVAAGASEVTPIGDEHGWLLGRIEDPFGHAWEIGKPKGDWPNPCVSS